MRIVISPAAEKSIFDLLDFIENEWSLQKRNLFLDNLLKKFEQISLYPRSCMTIEDFPDIYKCVVTKQTSFFLSNYQRYNTNYYFL